MQVSIKNQYLARLVDIATTKLVQGNFKTLYYTVEDYLDGKTFEQRIRDGDALEPVRRKRALRQVLQGLQSLHQRNLIHGNLHPGKVFLNAEEARALPFRPEPRQ